MSRKSCLLTMLFLIVIPLLIIGGAGVFGYVSYLRQKAELIRKIEAMPTFNPEKEGRELAAELKMRYPVKKPEKSLKKLMDQINKHVKKQVSLKYSARFKSSKMLSIIRNFSTAKPGKVISFQLIRRSNQNSGDIVRGVYKGLEPGGVGEELVRIDNERYPYSRVIPDNRYLFNERESKLMQEKHIQEFKKTFDKERKEYAEKLRSEYEHNILKKAGYFKNANGRWEPESKAFEEALSKKQKEFNKKRRAKIKKLIKKSKLFGFVTIEFSKPELKELMNGGDNQGASDNEEDEPNGKKDEDDS